MRIRKKDKTRAKISLEKVRRLRQTDEIWEGTARRAPVWITPRRKAPYRPYVIMFVTRKRVAILGTDMGDDKPTPDKVLNVLIKAMRHPAPGAGRPRRPSLIYLDNEELVEALAPQLSEIDVRCQYLSNLRLMGQVLRDMERHMTGREPLPGLLKTPGVTPHMVGGLFEAAAFYYERAPWRWLDDSHPIEVRYPPSSRTRYAVVMGQAGETFGLARYDSAKELKMIYSGLPPRRLMGKMTWISLLFGEVTEVPFDDLDDMEEYGWPVAGEHAYPIPLRVTRSGKPVRPGKSELLWFEAVLLALPTFLREHLRAHRGRPRPAEATLTVWAADGPTEIFLRYPATGFEE